jgi:3-oxoadipate enol-lactonase
MENGFITIGDSKMYYEKAGQGDVVIFLHADTLDCRQWDNQFAYFSKKYTVIRYDIRGFGKSENPKSEPYSFSEDLHILMDSLFIKKAHLIGLSLGAAVILDFTLTHPDKVRSLVLVDPGISGDGFEKPFIEKIQIIQKFAKSGNLTGAKKMWSDLSFFDTSRNNQSVWKRVQTMVSDSSGYRWFGENQPIDIDPPAVRRLQDIKVSTLILVGEHDINDFQRKSTLLHEKILGSQLVIVPQAGHLSNMDNPGVFNSAVDLFISK